MITEATETQTDEMMQFIGKKLGRAVSKFEVDGWVFLDEHEEWEPHDYAGVDILCWKLLSQGMAKCDAVSIAKKTAGTFIVRVGDIEGCTFDEVSLVYVPLAFWRAWQVLEGQHGRI